MIDLDDTDRAILRALVADATRSAGAIGRALGLSQPAAWRRIRRLEEAGILASRRVDLDAEKLGFDVTVIEGATRAIDLGGTAAATRQSFATRGIKLR